jgi:hypothetical protein
MNFCSLLDQLHEKIGQKTNVMFTEWDITTYLHTQVYMLSKQRDGIDKYDIETDYIV